MKIHGRLVLRRMRGMKRGLGDTLVVQHRSHHHSRQENTVVEHTGGLRLFSDPAPEVVPFAVVRV